MFTVLMGVAVVAGSQTDSTIMGDLGNALDLELTQFKGFWKHVTLIGLMATGVFLRVVRRR